MVTDVPSLLVFYRGWDGYEVALEHALRAASPEHLAWRGAPHLRSVGEIAGHIVAGRVNWFHRVLGEGDGEFAARVAGLTAEDIRAIEGSSAQLVVWLQATWQVIETALRRWTVNDLQRTVLQDYQGQTYALPRQWVLWRVLSHDIHHGGEVAYALGMQGVSIPELGDQGGHLIPPPLAKPPAPAG